MEMIRSFFKDYVAWLTMPAINIIDIIEILIIAFAVYHIIIWIKDTRAWALMKGIVVHCMADCRNFWNECIVMDFPECDGDRNYCNCNYFPAGVSQCIGTAWAKIIFIY